MRPVALWFGRASTALSFAGKIAFILFFSTAGPLCSFVCGRRLTATTSFSLVLLPLAMATLILPVLVFLVPNLAGSLRVKFPVTFTLPMLMTAVTVLLAFLLSNYLSPLTTLGDEPRTDVLWLDIRVVSAAITWQIGTLLVLSSFDKEPRPS